MKKRISLLLAVVMVLGSFASVFATDVALTKEEADAAKFLEENGILIGNSGGLLLDKELIRQDSVILLSRLLGVEDEAKNHPITNSIKKFKDLPNDNYYKRNISWAVEEEYYEGTSADKFSPRRALRVEEYATVLMRALGHSEEDWRKNYDKAVELGILENVNVKGPEQDILRKDVAVMTYNALGVKVKGLDKTLAQVLGIVMPEKPEVPEEDKWELVIDAPEALKADGLATGIVKFGLYKNGKLDTSANKVVLDVNTTYGSLSQKRVTIQNGEAELILRSEFQNKPVIARIDALIIEAEGEHKDLIGKVVAKPAAVQFNHEGKGEQVVIKQLLQVNSNEADRVTMIFDEEVTLRDFYEVNEDTNELKLKEGKPILKTHDGEDVVKITQADGPKKIAGILIDEKNPKAATVVLEKDSYLTDNKDVEVSAEINEYTTKAKKTFKLTDARKPNMTGVKTIDNRTLEVSFSEPIYSADFVIDGRAEGNEVDVKNMVELQKAAEKSKTKFVYAFGDIKYNKLEGKFIDTRNIATIRLTKEYKEDGIPKGYFKPGKHSVQASNIEDFAARTDKNNVGTTQSLSFLVEEDKTETEPTVVVESPEQFRVKFNNQIVFEEGTDLEKLHEVFKLKVRDPKTGKWELLEDGFDTIKKGEQVYRVTEVGDGSEYKVELTKDWTEIYKTNQTKSNYYNNRFRLDIEKGKVITVSNGNKNKSAFELDLSYSGSPLTKPDTVSPVIKDIKSIGEGRFEVEMDEPVKLAVKDENGKIVQKPDTSKSDTLAQDQGSLPATMVEFIGKDKDGYTVTLPGEVEDYSKYDTAKTDRFITVRWVEKDGETPQTVVNAGGSEEWTVVVKAISDDVGNVAATETKTFKLKPITVSSEFRVARGDGGNAVGEDINVKNFLVKGEEDKITITFTKDVSVVGINAATDVKNYTLNGRDLPAGTKILLGEKDNQVIISLPEGTLQESNIIVLAGQIQAKDGDKLIGDKAFTFKEDGIIKNNAHEFLALWAKEEEKSQASKIRDAENREELAGLEAHVEMLKDAYNSLSADAKGIVDSEKDGKMQEWFTNRDNAIKEMKAKFDKEDKEKKEELEKAKKAISDLEKADTIEEAKKAADEFVEITDKDEDIKKELNTEFQKELEKVARELVDKFLENEGSDEEKDELIELVEMIEDEITKLGLKGALNKEESSTTKAA